MVNIMNLNATENKLICTIKNCISHFLNQLIGLVAEKNVVCAPFEYFLNLQDYVSRSLSL